MCGIGGYFGSFDPKVLKNMSAAMAHRGPDGDGFWHNNQHGIGFVHRRLSILDLSTAANQPMHAVGDRYALLFNGEIYNFKRLYEELKEKYQINPNSDTSVIAPLYDAYGEDMYDHLNGMFSIALWDKATQTLRLARDHMGIKPVYYVETEQGLVFASELKTILAAVPNLDKELNANAMADYLTYLWSPGEGTMFKAVKKLLPGHQLLAKRDGEGRIKISVHKFYTPPMVKQTKAKTPEDLRELFQKVVADQCVSDVPVGAFLSGGVDSSAIVAGMVHSGIQPKNTYCMTFHGGSTEEKGFQQDAFYARKVAKHLNIPLTEVASDATLLDELPNMVSMLEEPLADPAPLYVQKISEAARADGIKVLMSGTGGDDVFAGYRRHQAAVLRQHVGMLSTPIAQLLKAASHFSPQNLARRLKKLSFVLEGPEDAFLHKVFEFSPRMSPLSLFSDDVAHQYNKNEQNALKWALRASQGFPPLKRLNFMEYHGFLPDHNLTYTDKAAMAASVEVRVPLIDTRLVDFGAALPVNQLVHGKETKYLLKKAMEPWLPHDVLYRSKAGFGAPLRQWLLHDKRSLMEDILLGETTKQRGLFNSAHVEAFIQNTASGKVDGTYALLSLMMQELWCRRFIDM